LKDYDTAMTDIPLRPDPRHFLARVLGDLMCCGWTLESVPENGQVPRNGLKLVLRAGNSEIRLRVFLYKVTTSSRNRAHERRIEITTTYQSGLKRVAGFRDIVLGIDIASGNYVGVDSRRLEMGGEKHNASSFLDLEGLSVKKGSLLINPRQVTSSLFPSGIELQGFFDRSRLSEYLFNQREIHTGLYAFGGAFNGPTPTTNVAWPATVSSNKAFGKVFVLSSRLTTRRPKPSRQLIEAAEKQDFARLKKRKISPEQLKQILSVCDEIGALGEQAVLNAERKRLRKLGFNDQAKLVERVSLQSVGEGYDILSFEDDGITKRYVEVKATIGKGLVFDISRGEWRAAKKHGSHYYLACVISARDDPQIFFVSDPVALEQKGLVNRTAVGWKIDLRRVLNSEK
jgi:hypothetical protein